MKQYKSNVEGLDDLLRGGFVLPPAGVQGGKQNQQGLLLLIKGKAGTGKSTLALQLAIAASGWKLKNEKGKSFQAPRYLTCEQSEYDLKDRCKTFIGREIKNDVVINSKLTAGKINPQDIAQPLYSGSSNYNWINEQIRELVNPAGSGIPVIKYKALIIDGLNHLGINERQLLDFEYYVNALKHHSALAIIIYEPIGNENTMIDYLSDMVIELRGDEIDNHVSYFFNKLIISKSRYQQSVLGWHQYKIKKADEKAETSNKNGGIYIYPSIHYIVHHHNILDQRLQDLNTSMGQKANQSFKPAESGYIQSAEPSLLEGLIDFNFRFIQGSCTVVLGDRGSFKTQLTLDFLRTGGKSKIKGLLLSLFDNDESVAKNISCIKYCIESLPGIGEKMCQNCFENKNYEKGCYQYIHNYHFRPGCVSTNEFFYMLSNIISQLDKIDRLVFWDLCQLDYRFPLLSSDYMFFPGLINYLKEPKIKNVDANALESCKNPISSVFMGSLNSKLSKAAYVMADNVFFCWQGTYDICDRKAEGFYVIADRIENMPTFKKCVFLEKKTSDQGIRIIGIHSVEFTDIKDKLESITNQIQSL